MPKSNFNHFLNECDHFTNIGTYKNKSKISFEPEKKSNMFISSNISNANVLSNSCLEKTTEMHSLQNNNENFPSLSSSSSSSASFLSDSKTISEVKFKNFKDAIISAPSPTKMKKLAASAAPIQQVSAPQFFPPPLLVKKESEIFKKKMLEKKKNINNDDDDDDNDDDDDFNKTYYDDGNESDY